MSRPGWLYLQPVPPDAMRSDMVARGLRSRSAVELAAMIRAHEVSCVVVQRHVHCILCSIRSTNEGLSSMPTHLLPRSRAANNVVPEPA